MLLCFLQKNVVFWKLKANLEAQIRLHVRKKNLWKSPKTYIWKPIKITTSIKVWLLRPDPWLQVFCRVAHALPALRGAIKFQTHFWSIFSPFQAILRNFFFSPIFWPNYFLTQQGKSVQSPVQCKQFLYPRHLSRRSNSSIGTEPCYYPRLVKYFHYFCCNLPL